MRLHPRTLVCFTFLLSGAAQAHVVGYDFFQPSGVSGRTDGGFYPLSWVDGPDPQALAAFTLHAQRNGTAPFSLPVVEATIEGVPRPVPDLADLAVWDARAVAPGCYQPFARMTDPEEGVTWRLADGLITVAAPDGGNLPPAVWVNSPSFLPPAPDGTLALRIAHDDPDDPLELSVFFAGADGDGGLLAAGLPLPKGRGEVTYTVNPALLPPLPFWYFRAEVKSPDGLKCSAWWAGALPNTRDAGSPPDAGGSVAEVDAGTAEVPVRPGCGCSSSGPLGFALLAAVGLALRRRRSLLLAALGVLACGPGFSGSQTSALIGGTSDTADPAVVSLTAAGYPACSGTLINPFTVLTAGHCANLLGPGDFYEVHFGFDTQKPTSKVQVDEQVTHPQYTAEGKPFDFALLRLRYQVVDVSPVPLRRVAMDAADVGSIVRHVGYGISDEAAGTGNGNKRQAVWEITNVDDTWLYSGSAGHQTCTGDSGGAALLAHGTVEELAGVVSDGPSCHEEGWDGRVDTVVDWIDSTSGPWNPTPKQCAGLPMLLLALRRGPARQKRRRGVRG